AVIVALAAALRLLRRARFAADEIARYVRPQRSSFLAADADERLAHLRGDFLRDDAAHFRRWKLGDLAGRGIADLVDDLRRHQPAAIRDHADRIDDLDRRHADLLAHRQMRDGNLRPLARRMDHARQLAREIDPRPLAETEAARELEEPLVAELNAKF